MVAPGWEEGGATATGPPPARRRRAREISFLARSPAVLYDPLHFLIGARPLTAFGARLALGARGPLGARALYQKKN
jgi:hypothetical protein